MTSNPVKLFLFLACFLCATRIIGVAQRPSREQMIADRNKQVFVQAKAAFDGYFVEVGGFFITQRRASNINAAGDSINDLLYCTDLIGFDNPVFEAPEPWRKSDVEQVANFKIIAGRVFVFEGYRSAPVGQDENVAIMVITLHKLKQIGWRVVNTTFAYGGGYSVKNKKRSSFPTSQLTMVRPEYSRPPNGLTDRVSLSINVSEAKKIMAIKPSPPAIITVTPDSAAESFAADFVGNNFLYCEDEDLWYSIVDGGNLLEVKSLSYDVHKVNFTNISDPAISNKYRAVSITGRNFRNHAVNRDYVDSRSSTIIWVIVDVSTNNPVVDSIKWANPKTEIKSFKKPSSCNGARELKAR